MGIRRFLGFFPRPIKEKTFSFHLFLFFVATLQGKQSPAQPNFFFSLPSFWSGGKVMYGLLSLAGGREARGMGPERKS